MTPGGVVPDAVVPDVVVEVVLGGSVVGVVGGRVAFSRHLRPAGLKTSTSSTPRVSGEHWLSC